MCVMEAQGLKLGNRVWEDEEIAWDEKSFQGLEELKGNKNDE